MNKAAATATLTLAATVVMFVAPLAPSPTRRASGAYTTWSSYLGSADSAQYTALDQINRSSVSRLEIAWTFPVGTRTFLLGPLVADGLIFVLAGANDLVALDAATGAQVWSRPHAGAVGTRGLNYWRSADGTDHRLLYMAGGYLTAVNARTGDRIAAFGDAGQVDLRKALAATGRELTGVMPLQTSNPGRVFEDLIIMGLPAQGSGYDATPR